MEPIVILLAFVAGLAFKRFGYPPMPGYLLAGFLAHALGLGDIDLISAIADIGLLLLLFTIGLKLNIRDILMPQVWGVAGLQMLIAVPLTTVGIVLSGILFPVLALQVRDMHEYHVSLPLPCLPTRWHYSPNEQDQEI